MKYSITSKSQLEGVSYICRSRATPAKTHLEGLSLDLRLNVQM